MFINLILNCIFILVSSLLITAIICESSLEKSEKQLKYDACYKLVQSRAEQDKDHFKELSSELKPSTKRLLLMALWISLPISPKGWFVLIPLSLL